MPYWFLFIIWASYLGYVRSTLQPGTFKGKSAKVGYTMPLVMLPLVIAASAVYLFLAIR